MSSFLKSLGGSNPSSRRGSIVNDPNLPSTKEVKTAPASGTKLKTTRKYSDEQKAKIEELRKYAFGLILPETDSYYPWEKRFLEDPGCMPRYCRAAKWNMANAKERIHGTIEWRREYKPDLIKPDDVKVEAETGKIILNGFDSDGRPVIYMRPGRENTEKSPRQIQHLIFHLERAIDFAPPGVETVTIVVDYASATSQSNPSIGTARQALNILQNHYVERMGRAIVVNMPWWVNAFMSAIQPFMDPVTKEKIKFNPEMGEIVPASQLDTEFGGQYNYKFDHEVYWKTLIDQCYIAPDGSRLDKNGNHVVPPLGNGAKAAAESAQQGKSPEVNAQSPSKVRAQQNEIANRLVTEEKTSAGPYMNGNAISPSDQNHFDPSQLSEKMSHLSTTAQPTAMATNEHAGAAPRSNQSPALPTIPLEAIDAHETAPGPPAGPVVFDHPPSEREKEEAREVIEHSAGN